jgi:hypothetical protein
VPEPPYSSHLPLTSLNALVAVFKTRRGVSIAVHHTVIAFEMHWLRDVEESVSVSSVDLSKFAAD